MDNQPSKDLTPTKIFQITQNIREGSADPEDAKCLMELFCYFVNKAGNPTKELFGYRPDELMPKELLWHFKDAFNAILNGEKTPERALGLTRKKARPKADPEIRANMAHKVLQLRLNGISHQEALQQTSEKFGWGVTIIGEAWAQNKFEGMLKERFERPKNNLWTEEEKKILYKIFPL